MKIKTKKITWAEVPSLPKIPHLKLRKPNFLFQLLVRILSIPALLATGFSYTKVDMEKAGEGPYLILMNHSSFLDLKMASKILFPLKYGIVSTTDAFVGKAWLMRLIGCIPTQKFVTDVSLVLDLIRAIKKKKISVLMYPEAGYSFDGTATTLPRRLGKLLKRLDVPVLMIRSDAGGFLRDPLYNGLRLRKVKVSATLSCLLSREEIRSMSDQALDEVLDRAFAFDHFQEQKDKKISITEPFRATGLERVLYRCPHCQTEGKMKGEGIFLSCHACGKKYEMKPDGSLAATEGITEFSHVPHWFSWQRACVRKELEEGRYLLETPVSVGIISDHKRLYLAGDGVLRHDRHGITLTSQDASLTYTQDPYFSYSLNVDFFWYEISDTISFGTKDRLYYCFPKDPIPVTKARLAAEEMYQMPKLSPALAKKE